VPALIAAAAAAFLAVAIATWPPIGIATVPGGTIALGVSWTTWGQALALDAAARPPLAFVFGLAAAGFLGAAILPQGRTFAPLGLVVLSGYAAALLIHPLFMVPAALAATAAVAVFFIQGGQPGAARGAARQMFFPYLAFPFFLLAAWYVEQAPLNPDDPSPLHSAGRLVLWGFFFLVGAAPLHSAMPAIIAEAPPLAGALAVLWGNVAILTLLIRFPAAYSWATQQANVGAWLIGLGLLTALWGGVGALGQRDFGRLLGYAALHDYGALLLGLGMQGPLGVAAALNMMLARSLSLLLSASALSVLRARLGSDSFARVRGAAARTPWAAAGLMVGGMGLVGWPLTAGFGARWGLLRLLLEDQQRIVIALFAVSAACVALGYVRGAAVLMGRIPPERVAAGPVEREPARAIIWIAALLLVVALVALAPQIAGAWIGTALDALTAPAP
jgi:formate hydrogenlyase subunit 3/multisubunit Na+/H+ antiporter MnhD subunit